MREAISSWARGLFQSPVERERKFYQRYRALSAAIDEVPDCMANYVLRGELSLEHGDGARARADFAAALTLAEALDASQGWLIVEQALRDRALYGLERARQFDRNVEA